MKIKIEWLLYFFLFIRWLNKESKNNALAFYTQPQFQWQPIRMFELFNENHLWSIQLSKKKKNWCDSSEQSPASVSSLIYPHLTVFLLQNINSYHFSLNSFIMLAHLKTNIFVSNLVWVFGSIFLSKCCKETNWDIFSFLYIL